MCANYFFSVKRTNTSYTTWGTILRKIRDYFGVCFLSSDFLSKLFLLTFSSLFEVYIQQDSQCYFLDFESANKRAPATPSATAAPPVRRIPVTPSNCNELQSLRTLPFLILSSINFWSPKPWRLFGSCSNNARVYFRASEYSPNL